MCQYMGLGAYGPDLYLRAALRKKLRDIEFDDAQIERDGGIGKLRFRFFSCSFFFCSSQSHFFLSPRVSSTGSDVEVRAACAERGMRASGVAAVAHHRRQLEQWLQLSLHQGAPTIVCLVSASGCVYHVFQV